MNRLYCYIVIVATLFFSLEVQAKGANIKFQDSLHNFEMVDEDGGTVAHNFVFTNTGDEPLLIFDVNTNCGCTKAVYPLEPILPGKQDSIAITFDPKGNLGEFAKEIVIKSNAKRKKTRLHIKGVVIPKQ